MIFGIIHNQPTDEKPNGFYFPAATPRFYCPENIVNGRCVGWSMFVQQIVILQYFVVDRNHIAFDCTAVSSHVVCIVLKWAFPNQLKPVNIRLMCFIL